MAARLAVRNWKQAITRERELFSEIPILKPSEFSEDLSGKFIFIFVSRTSYAGARLVTDRHDMMTTVTLVLMRRALSPIQTI